jgi:hypothetical protein
MIRRLALALVNWLIARFNLSVIEESRLLGGMDAVERGARWEGFYREEGGLADMLADLRREAFETAAELKPEETDKIYYWAMADRNIRRLQQRIEAVIQHGQIEAERVKQIERTNAVSERLNAARLKV